MSIVQVQMASGTIVDVEFEPVARYRDDLVLQVGRQGYAENPEAVETSKRVRDGLWRMSSQQLVLTVTEVSTNFLAYAREIRRQAREIEDLKAEIALLKQDKDR